MRDPELDGELGEGFGGVVVLAQGGDERGGGIEGEAVEGADGGAGGVGVPDEGEGLAAVVAQLEARRIGEVVGEVNGRDAAGEGGEERVVEDAGLGLAGGGDAEIDGDAGELDGGGVEEGAGDGGEIAGVEGGAEGVESGGRGGARRGRLVGGELAAAAVQGGLDGADGGDEDLGDLFEGEVEGVLEDEGDALLRREAGDDRGGGGAGGARVGGGHRERRGLVVERVERRRG